MSVPHRQLENWHRLIAATVDGTIGDVEFALLCDLLRESVTARQFYVRYLDLHALLSRARRGEAAGAPRECESTERESAISSTARPVVPLSRRSAVSAPLRWLAPLSHRVPGGEITVGAMVVLVIVAAFWGLSQAMLYPRRGNDDGMVVATISGTSNATWSFRNSSLADGLQVKRSEPLQIETGLVELKLLQGATLLIEGPAAWSIDGKNHASLLHGKLVAKVPSEAVGFSLNTPIGRIVDLGTEFGAAVHEDGESEIHVYSGKVNAFVAQSAADDAPQKTELRTGQSLRLRSVDGRIESHQQATDPDRFVRHLKASPQRIFAKGSVGRGRLLLDTALLVHYTFDKPDDESTILVNHSAATRGKYDGEISGCDWTTGSKGKRSALQFSKPDDRVQLQIDGQFNALTIGASIYLEPLTTLPAYTPILMGDRWGIPGQFHLQLHGDAQPNISICGQQEKVHGVSCQNSLGKGDFGRWLKLAVILDTQSREVVYFIDGAIHGTSAMPVSERLTLANAHIGYWLPWKKESARQFTGRIDELLIFSRALRPQETRDLFHEELARNE